ncbi:uncharacterized protein C21orf58 [Erpetoichthys calabaricus]|uniref:uncharacterized protein C21orf58 n=1 Tax=Erpetoichthys calabaricus TaxID=27687 RepID=UPI0022342867|nr:uncharacterized protein C21orf58 [Erpetoichthys calabaricus]
MADPIVDQMTRLKLKLLEKKLENERENADERSETAYSTSRSYDGHEDALHSALRRKRDLLQKLREQHMLDELSRPHTWGGTRKKYHQQDLPPVQFYQIPAPPPPPPPPPPEPPRIIQHTMPQQPATIIQQLPQQQPLIAQIPPPQPLPPIRSGSIKEDMVEMMLMQNAQMHQIIMQNMMLKALPPMAFTPPGSCGNPAPSSPQPRPDNNFVAPIVVKSDRPRASSVHHHHHYTPPALQGPPLPNQLPPIGYPMWPPGMSSNPLGQAGGFPPSLPHMNGPVTLPALYTMPMDGYHYKVPQGL